MYDTNQPTWGYEWSQIPSIACKALATLFAVLIHVADEGELWEGQPKKQGDNRHLELGPSVQKLVQ